MPQQGSFTPPVTADEVTAVDSSVAVAETPVDIDIPLNPVYSETTTDTNLGTIGVVLSGAQLFNDYEDQERSFVAVDDNFQIDGVSFVDSCNGHPLALQADGTGGGTYHYHGIPYCITDAVDTEGEHSTVLGFLIDGFPFYGPQTSAAPDFSEAAVTLGVTTEELEAALGQPPPAKPLPLTKVMSPRLPMSTRTKSRSVPSCSKARSGATASPSPSMAPRSPSRATACRRTSTWTVYTVPEDAIIFGIALNDDRSTMAITYSPDFTLEGSGLALLDLETGDLTTVLDVETDVYFTDPMWSIDGQSVLATRVDRRGEDESLDVARIDVAGSDPGAVDIVITDAINPVDSADGIAYLAVDDDGARRSVRSSTKELDIATGDLDLDHLIADDNGTLWVAALDAIDDTGSIAGLAFGQSADAHGNHDRPSAWWDLDVSAGEPVQSEAAAIIVYDAVFGDDAIVSATNEGVSIIHVGAGADQTRLDLIASRAIRFVAT